MAVLFVLFFQGSCFTFKLISLKARECPWFWFAALKLQFSLHFLCVYYDADKSVLKTSL